jgi:catechol 2,3-dioxygenase-like lactoylglutathione lyase family enzyme
MALKAQSMAKPIHIMIRVLDEARAIDFYRRAFGLDVADRFVFDDFTLVYLRNPEAHFEAELTVNHGRTKVRGTASASRCVETQRVWSATHRGPSSISHPSPPQTTQSAAIG